MLIHLSADTAFRARDPEGAEGGPALCREPEYCFTMIKQPHHLLGQMQGLCGKGVQGNRPAGHTKESVLHRAVSVGVVVAVLAVPTGGMGAFVVLSAFLVRTEGGDKGHRAAFASADPERSVLFIDEAESLLSKGGGSSSE